MGELHISCLKNVFLFSKIVQNDNDYKGAVCRLEFACRFNQRVDREDITIIILDTKLVPDFVLHACCFFIAGNRPV